MTAHPPVLLAVDACVPDAAEVRHVAAVELGELLTDDVGPGSAYASVGCEGAVAILRVDDPITHHSLWRRIDVAHPPSEVRARLVALALVELLAASWEEDEAIASPPALAPPEPQPTLAARASEPAYRAVFTASSAWFAAEPTALPGASVRFARTSRQLALALDAQFHAGTATTSAGTIATDLVAVGAAVELPIDTARARFAVGAGVRGGEARMTGSPATMSVHASTLSAPWLGAFVHGTASVPITDRLTAEVAIETGRVLSPVTALVDGQRQAAIDGSWLQLDLGIGFHL